MCSRVQATVAAKYKKHNQQPSAAHSGAKVNVNAMAAEHQQKVRAKEQEI